MVDKSIHHIDHKSHGQVLSASPLDNSHCTVTSACPSSSPDYPGFIYVKEVVTLITEKTKIKRPVNSKNLYSTLNRKGKYSPENPQRPPQVVEPDGKRYSIHGRQAEYLGWQFNFRISSFSGPQLFNVKFQGERIAYELSLSEIAAFYSGYSPLSQATDYVDSGALSSLGSKALVPGGDCPDSATLIPYTVWNQHGEEPGEYAAAFCMFEHNNGYPLRRHLSYSKPDGYYGGMLDSVLTLRSIMEVGNYDYVLDFIFHQNGALETRLMSTGYIQSNFYRTVERDFGVKIQETITGNLHHHMFNLKADLDVSGNNNRYETLDIQRMDATLSWDKEKNYGQTKYTTNLKSTEQESLYRYDINTPKYHIVHNNQVNNTWGEKKAYSIHLSGMSKNLIPEGEFNEPAISWARHQIAVTKRKEEEFLSSSNYGMYDTLNPVVNFSKFYEDNENIVDQVIVVIRSS
ncbi:amine oxidase [Elysia marginata]|uniref:Amine oxidase n=1 Tax=Elysia marginata TaxID=1093978 RepID=A0AAV4JVU5_9GAST|nr:amine oxidase [Elysia marginata]